MAIRSIQLLCLFALMGCASQTSPSKHIFYLHGMIVEIQGIHAVSEQFGPYEYTAIIDSLKATGAQVHNEVRTQDTDFIQFAEKTSQQIDRLIARGVSPADITVIGASKGGMLAMNISHLNMNPINYVLLGADSDYSEKTFDWSLHGNILGIYEKSDDIAGKNYQFWKDKSPEAIRFERLEINTGLNHGFLFRPIKEWLEPAKAWIIGQY